jgi:hypothetical protein
MVWVWVVGGVLALAIGVLWVLQGSGAMGDNGGMDGESQWTVIGAVVALVGLVLLVAGLRRLRVGDGG